MTTEPEVEQLTAEPAVERLTTEPAVVKRKGRGDTFDNARSTHILELFNEYQSQVEPLKKFKNLKAMWERISDEVTSTSGIKTTSLQCSTRYIVHLLFTTCIFALIVWFVSQVQDDEETSD